MIKILHRRLLLAFMLIASSLIGVQQKAVAQLQLNATQPGTNINVDPQYIELLPTGAGYQKIPTGNSYMVSYIDNPPAAEALYANNLFSSSNFTKTINTALPVGSVNGEAGTTPTGGATYTLPIAVPPGTNGMSPNISINYNSQGGNGPLGMGWNLGGLSMITRVGQNVYNDNYTKPVGLDAPLPYGLSDKFALDGQRLIMTNGTIYGVNNSVYATESDDFSRITAFADNTTDGPTWFKVETKNGLTLEYGNTEDSKIRNDATISSISLGISGVSQGAVVMMWRLNKISDAFGNYMELKYAPGGSREIGHILEINYTGNSSANILPYSSIKFEWETRDDRNTAYIAGQSFTSNLLLRKIRVFAEANNLMKEYRFNYSKDNLYSYLREVVELGNDYSQLNSTIFKYGDTGSTTLSVYNSLDTNPINSISGGNNKDIFLGDFDGDGLTDVSIAPFTTSPEGFRQHQDMGFHKKSESTILDASFTNVGTEITPTSYTIANKDYSATQRMGFSLGGDFDGDGRTDLVYLRIQNSSLEKVSIKYSTGVNTGNNLIGFSAQSDNLIPTAYNTIVSGIKTFFLTGDFNGDGLADYITLLKSTSSCTSATSSCFAEYKAFISFPALNLPFAKKLTRKKDSGIFRLHLA